MSVPETIASPASHGAKILQQLQVLEKVLQVTATSTLQERQQLCKWSMESILQESRAKAVVGWPLKVDVGVATLSAVETHL